MAERDDYSADFRLLAWFMAGALTMGILVMMGDLYERYTAEPGTCEQPVAPTGGHAYG